MSLRCLRPACKACYWDARIDSRTISRPSCVACSCGMLKLNDARGSSELGSITSNETDPGVDPSVTLINRRLFVWKCATTLSYLDERCQSRRALCCWRGAPGPRDSPDLRGGQSVGVRHTVMTSEHGVDLSRFFGESRMMRSSTLSRATASCVGNTPDTHAQAAHSLRLRPS
jgi:hypothetical protein